MKMLIITALLAILSLAPQPAKLTSRLVAVEVKTVTPDQTYGGVAYVKVAGTVRGVVDAREEVVGLAALPKNAAGQYEYASNFEIIAPATGQPANEALYIDSENRGSAISQGALGGFLQTHATSYARVQWQTGISSGVPANAQGVSLVIMRDFARFMAGRTPEATVTGAYKPTPHGKLILGGVSQSAWLVNTFVAEGFNVDPVTGRGVFDGAIAIDGAGNWLAINRMGEAAGAPQSPYVVPDGLPMRRDELLTRPRTDPFYVDVANYTDFYRLRAGLTSTDFSGSRFRRYDWPSPHAVGSAAGGGRCNGGQPVTYNTIRYAPYFRAAVLGIEEAIGVRAAKTAKRLPKSTVFELGDQPPPSDGFNGLGGVTVRVPKVDAFSMPLGGVRFPESEVALGSPVPVAISPVNTTSIANTCGNFGGWKALGADQVRVLHGDEARYMAGYTKALDRLINNGFLLTEDRAALLEGARRNWRQATAS